MRALEKRSIPRMDGTEVTFLGFGALEIGRNWGMGSDTERPDAEMAGVVLNTVLDAGINLIDTACAYHRSEERIGASVSNRRKEFVLASKCGEHSSEPTTYYDFSYKAVSESIDESLVKLKTDVIDLMQIHFGPNPQKVLDDGETVRAMKDAQKAGKIRFLGASMDGDIATQCIKSGDFDVMQMAFNMNDHWNMHNVELCKEAGIGVLVRCGMGNGLFTPRVLSNMDKLNDGLRAKMTDALNLLGGLNETAVEKLMAMNMRFLYETPGLSSVIIGTKKPENVLKNVQLMDADVDSELFAKVKAIFGV